MQREHSHWRLVGRLPTVRQTVPEEVCRVDSQFWALRLDFHSRHQSSGLSTPDWSPVLTVVLGSTGSHYYC